MTEFSQRLLAWYDRCGRKDLPWQQRREPYQVWVSEIMLQQTQVATVIPYYQRFLARFPDVQALACAAPDEVLHLWSGLGYYARARNLHQAAIMVCERHHGVFPREFEAVAALPGIGRSTAGAILAISTGQRHAILDGNVKRVLTRLHAIAGWPGQREIEQQLWRLADHYTPAERAADYTQAIMDLGATCCTRARPRCAECPVQTLCLAFQQGAVGQYPTPKPHKDLPVRATTMVLALQPSGAVLLEQRPASGLWGGLWSLPELPEDQSAQDWCAARFGITVREREHWPVLRHTFSHFHLDILPLVCEVIDQGLKVMEPSGIVWYNSRVPDPRGLAAPVQRLLDRLTTDYPQGETS